MVYSSGIFKQCWQPCYGRSHYNNGRASYKEAWLVSIMDDSNAEEVAVDGGSFSVLDVILIAASIAIILLLVRRFTGKKKNDHFPKLRIDPT